MTTAQEIKTYISVNDTAKLIRAALKAKFGKFPFSVRGKKYSGGSSITVYWTDGPTGKQVEAVIDKYHGAEFDGMTDMKSYHDADTLIAKDGTVRHVHYANDYVFTARNISQHNELVAQAESMIRSQCRCEGQAPNDRFGNEWVSHLASRMVYAMDLRQGPNLEQAFRYAVLRENN